MTWRTFKCFLKLVISVTMFQMLFVSILEELIFLSLLRRKKQLLRKQLKQSQVFDKVNTRKGENKDYKIIYKCFILTQRSCRDGLSWYYVCIMSGGYVCLWLVAVKSILRRNSTIFSRSVMAAIISDRCKILSWRTIIYHTAIIHHINRQHGQMV